MSTFFSARARFAEQVVGTYFSLRAAMTLLAVGLPIALISLSLVDAELPVLGSLSEYYYSPARDLFVGAVVGTGITLICYRGYGPLENRLLIASGTLLIVVALVPTDPPDRPIGVAMVVHAAAAVGFFATFAASVWWCADDTLDPSRDPERRIRRYRNAYRVVAIVVVVAPASALGIVLVLGQGALAVLVVEAAAVLTFGLYWALKSYELRGTELQEQP